MVDACAFAGGQKLAAVTLGQENSVFVSNVVLYDLKEKGEQTTADGSGVEIPPMPITIFSTASCWRSWTGRP